MIILFIPYERILRCIKDEHVFKKCTACVFYYTLIIPPLETTYVCNNVKYVTSSIRPFILKNMYKNICNLSFTELCTTYMLNNKPITSYELLKCCTWHPISGQLNSEVLWGTVYTCDNVIVHTCPKEYLIMRLPENCETRYIPSALDNRMDVAVRSTKDNYAYFLCPIEGEAPQTEQITHIDTLYLFNNIHGCDFADTDTEYVRSVLTAK